MAPPRPVVSVAGGQGDGGPGTWGGKCPSVTGWREQGRESGAVNKGVEAAQRGREDRYIN